MMIVKSSLVIAAHPDDEVLGCGGTIARIVDEGGEVNVAFLADGVFSRTMGSKSKKREMDARRKAAREACRLLGVSSVTFGDFPDNQMDTVSLLDVSKFVESLVREYGPDTIITHHSGDVNVDHQKAHAAVTVACRPQTNLSVRAVIFFEIPSSTEWQMSANLGHFVPNMFVDISSYVGRKIAALKIYQSEMRPWPHPRSIVGVTHLQSWRGATIGAEAAEAFIVGRYII
jgi:LmbE family N-acetylglucosaminyl deacetylase